MAARATGGLSTTDLDKIRASLAAGRKPKVVFTKNAGQIAGQTGQVIGLADPADGDEWVVTRFGRDELPFAPADLALAPKAAPAKRTRATATVPAPEPVPVTPAAPPPSPADSPPAPAPPGPDPKPVAKAPTPKPAVPTREAPVPATPAREPAPTPAKKAPPRKAGKPKGSTLTVTLAYTDGEWTVAAHHGARAIAKPAPIRAGQALKMVGLIDLPEVREAVEDVVTAARAEAEHEAERLRAELAEIETRLAELRPAD
jgi:hypothetical protein